MIRSMVPTHARSAALKLLCAVAASLVMVIVGAGTLTPAAHAAFGLTAFDGSVTDQAGNAFTQAGGHPFAASVTFEVNTTTDAQGILVPDGGGVKNVVVDLPAGFVGNPTAVSTCTSATFTKDPEGTTNCPASTQVGVVDVTFTVISAPLVLRIPVYNLEPPSGVAAEFGFAILGSVVFFDASVRSDGDYGLRIRSRNTSEVLSLVGATTTFWGVPADPVHDAERVCQDASVPGCSVDIPIKPFLTNPTACTPAGTGLESKIHIESWDGGQDDASFFSHQPPGYPNPPSAWGPQQGPDGCEAVPFDPSIAVRPTTVQADSPTGLDVEISIPTDGLENTTGISQGELKQAKVTLPDGMTINPSSADGLEACSDAQLRLGSTDPVMCPSAAKIGTVEAETPVLEEGLTGGIFLRPQASTDPDSGDMFRLALVLESPERGLSIRLPGQVRANPVTGRLEATFDDNPQLPVSKIRLHFKSGPRAPLATPPTCGSKVVDAVFSSWSGKSAHLTDSFTIPCPGNAGFPPALTAGTENPIAGAFSPFLLRIDRADRQEYVSGVGLEMPAGLVAKLKGVPLCLEGQAAAGTCGPESRVGTTTVGAGAGANPFFLTGSVSLTGPYKGAPYGLSISVRAIAGPFDLGTVVVRQAIFVDPVDAHLTVVSDPLPTIVKGVPLRLRSINVDVNRPGFTVNPTSCDEMQVKVSMSSTAGSMSSVPQHFQAGNCVALPLRPKLSLRMLGKRQTSPGRHPGLRAVLTQSEGQANLERVAVRLPVSLALDPDNAASDSLCSFEEGTKADPQCPKSSIIGRARAVTPLLNRPLTGPVYFTRNQRIHPKTGNVIRTLPMLVIPLRGEVAINLIGRSSVKRGKLVNTFAGVPDAAVSKFTLRLRGGRRGILTNVRNLCRGKQIALLLVDGQNGKRADRNVRIKTPCAKKGKGSRAARRKGAAKRRVAARAIAQSGRDA